MKNIIVIVVIFIGIIWLSVYVVNFSSEHLTEPSPTTVNDQLPSDLESQSNNEGAVSITVTPKLSEWILEFEVVMNTHSIELSEDMTKISVLIVNEKEYKPISWEGAGPGGHHREGVLRFKSIVLGPEKLILKIKNIGGVSERLFQWQLN
ncbi:MAG: hypothetical protein A3B91_01855 [Candidatus Yanofskybacteria bacterium RIFCSPHIGHO2_02_FULL_41_29]|uniref:Uncharacterized protein n=1 Tax=Candidatus Yanofskybacteria bacterium RIFCSPHIGHO2_01_FULL_41_53 TaxID=1802663 RepID=A0A1F8EJA1_9BACT|nr:MAG: hypothetical protein A2650_04295 [Candidatus Yanofskybacteria bacterium RIFCSPHIGHO2_01_FULL_41_53]OGN11205.1 MAG: hypothetical protein A3B91_01855 [Candidatus Yanofskybacteria bacterium RIFCSPHIGHO2_02_FULL_41_29]OGN16952.1 MAG: hypothetical protein A3F48_00850 [Candidatus Yanofskybacteria bacterium RIFCSPHIGHO2_12_FULL_41_9]OGN22271.1 MAG: hypothetical protein A2916_04100 [Candidatus Yanofskybacteria bacterium RIFCSPLOWO2_01_FULL_41_67]OGN29639.1 MAG: hypothetical protein A3H54_00740 